MGHLQGTAGVAGDLVCEPVIAAGATVPISVFTLLAGMREQWPRVGPPLMPLLGP
jgi:hypothetical protein